MSISADASEESERMEKNVGYVLETARLAVPLGATRMVVHCGGQGKLTRDRAMRNSHENVKTSCVRWMRRT